MTIQATASPNYHRSLLHVYRSSDWTEWDGSLPIDLTADIEVTGTSVLNRGYTPDQSGANTIITVGAAERVKVYKAFVSPSADITGEVYLSVGATKIGTIQNPKSGGQYMLVSCFPDFEYGALGEDVTLTLPSATAVSLTVAYELV